MYVKYLNVSSHFVYWVFCNGKMIIHSHEKTLSWCPSLRDWVQRCGSTGAVRGHRKVSQFLLTAGPFGNDLTFCLWSCFSDSHTTWSSHFSLVLWRWRKPSSFHLRSLLPFTLKSPLPPFSFNPTLLLSPSLLPYLPPFWSSRLLFILHLQSTRKRPSGHISIILAWSYP